MTRNVYLLRAGFLFLVMSLFFPLYMALATDDLFTVLDAMAVSVGAGVLISYLPGLWRWMLAQRTTTGYLLVLGILATWTAAVSRLGWLWAWRLSGRPDEFMDQPFVAFTVYLFIAGGSLHLLASSAIDDQIPAYGWFVLATAIIFGFTLGLVMVWIA